MWHKMSALLAVLCLVPMAVPAEDDMGPPCGMMGGGMGMGPGMMGMGHGMGGGMMGMGPYHMLNLTDDQRSRINKMHDAQRHKHWETMGKIMDERAKLRDLYLADKLDTKRILKVQEEIDRMHRSMLEQHLNTRNQIDALLTPEQREQLKSYRRGGMGMGPGMMGRGGMGSGHRMMR